MKSEKNKPLLDTVISALALLPVAFLTVYLSMACSLRTINVFAFGQGAAGVFVPIFFAVYFVFLTLMIYISYGVKSGAIKCGFVKAEGVIFSTVSIALILNSFMVEWMNSFASPLCIVMLLIGILLAPRIGLVSCLTSVLIAAILECPVSYLLTPAEFSLATLLGSVDAFVAAFFVAFLLKGNKLSRFSLTWGTLAIAVCTSFIGGLLSLADSVSIGSFFNGYFSSVLGNVVSVCIFTAILPIYESVTRIWTDFKLAELCSLNQPILKQMSEEAPGTFSHELTVANLAEACASDIGLNPYLARACAYYHDIGKLNDPQFFSENQKGYNPHDDLIPEVSVAKIRKHTRDGYEKCMKYKFPDEVCKAALEHHGNTPIMFFYMKAKKLGGNVDISEFRYDCPTPTTKYSAIIMLCDICESMSRARPPESIEQLEASVAGVIKDKLTDGQFDKCDITISELQTIKATIVKVIPAILHKRIDYAKAKEER